MCTHIYTLTIIYPTYLTTKKNVHNFYLNFIKKYLFSKQLSNLIKIYFHFLYFITFIKLFYNTFNTYFIYNYTFIFPNILIYTLSFHFNLKYKYLPKFISLSHLYTNIILYINPSIYSIIIKYIYLYKNKYTITHTKKSKTN